MDIQPVLNVIPRYQRVVPDSGRLLDVGVIDQMVGIGVRVDTILGCVSPVMFFLNIFDLVLDDKVLQVVVLRELELTVINAFAVVSIAVVPDRYTREFRVALLKVIEIFVDGIGGYL